MKSLEAFPYVNGKLFEEQLPHRYLSTVICEKFSLNVVC